MKTGIKKYLVSFLRHNWPAFIVVSGAYIFGLAAGKISVEKLHAEQNQELIHYLDNFTLQIGSMAPGSNGILWDAIFGNILIMASLYALGLTVIGMPVILGIIFTRGMMLGFVISFIAKEKSFHGTILVCSAILPQNILLIPVLIMGGVFAFSFSLLITRRFLDSNVKVWPGFVLYSGLMFILAGCSVAAAIIEVFFTPVLLNIASGFIFFN